MKFYRYEEIQYSRIGIKVLEREFEFLSETPCGYWIKLFEMFDDKKWVSKTAKKRFAYPTREEALSSFIARKTRQVDILEGQLASAKMALMLGKEKWQKEQL